MKEIHLTRGLVALVDDEDYEWINKFRWYSTNGYATRREGNRDNRMSFLMHRDILGLIKNDGILVDHINHDTLDNRKENLRKCGYRENSMNQKISSRNKVGHKGVYFHAAKKKWMARVYINGKQTYLGYFLSVEAAHKAYCDAAVKHYGEFANFGDGCVILGDKND
jgi:hypothetical protein